MEPRGGATPAPHLLTLIRDAVDVRMQQTTGRLAQGAWPLRSDDCISGPEGVRYAVSGERTGTAAVLSTEWEWNRLLTARRGSPDLDGTHCHLVRLHHQTR